MNHQDAKSPRVEIPAELDRIAKTVVDAAYVVHSTLGPGLLENVYEMCLAHELELRRLKVERQLSVPVYYRDLAIEAGYRLDLLINDSLLVELKAVEQLLPLHQAQVMTYLKLSGLRLGLLINFNVPLIKNGIKRIIL